MFSKNKMSDADKEVLKNLLESPDLEIYTKSDLKRYLENDNNPLLDHYSHFLRETDRLKLLLDAGFDPNSKDPEGFTPLLLIVEKGMNRDVALVKELIEAGADPLASVSLRNQLGVKRPYRNALKLAEMKRLNSIVDYLRPITEQAHLEKTLSSGQVKVKKVRI